MFISPILGKDARDFGFDILIAPGNIRQALWITPLSDALMIDGWGNRQNPANRLDPIFRTMLVYEGRHRLNGRSSSAWAKYALALQYLIGLTKLPVLAFQRLQAICHLCGLPARLPLSTSAFFTHSFNVCAEHPIFSAIDTIAAQREG